MRSDRVAVPDDDICLWPDGEACYGDDLSTMSHKSPDYERIPFDSPRWHKVKSDMAGGSSGEEG